MSFVTVSMNPAQATNSMRREIERLLRDDVPVRTSPSFVPAANGYEDANGFVMEFEVPGFAADQLEVTAQDGALLVKGTLPARTLSEGTRALFAERSAKSFERQLRLPKTADVASITASHANGVLTVKVAKLATVAPRKVTINASDVSAAPATN
ncbi:MAG: Hsp20/alpha crystallin family protein [Gemmatimonadaceae bacterium]